MKKKRTNIIADAEPPTRVVSFRTAAEKVELLDRLAESQQKTRAELVESFVDKGVKNLRRRAAAVVPA